MRIYNWKIGAWLFAGFSIILAFVIVIGVTSYYQTNQLSTQTEIMYNHPLVVRRSIDNIQFNTSELRLEFRDLILADTQSEIDNAHLHMELAVLEIENEFKVLEESYLGPEEDVQDAYQAFVLWSHEREHNMELLESGTNEDIETILESIGAGGEEALKRDIFITKIEVIDAFAQNKADELYLTSQELHTQMTTQLIVIVGLLFVFTILIGLWLYRSFQKPLSEINNTILDFQSGDMTSRVELDSSNELGTLAKSVDDMASIIEENEKLFRQVNDFAETLIVESDLKEFMRTVLKTMISNTNSVSAVAYMIDDSSDYLTLYESIGLTDDTPRSFGVKQFEGEFGIVLINKEPCVFQINPERTQFTFKSVVGDIIPSEVMCVPIVLNDKVNAVIVLVNVDGFLEIDHKYIDRILDNLTSRTEAIIATEKITNFVEELEQRSHELQAQNVELERQKRQLNEASKLKSNFLSNMSHELRTPLNSVIALSGVLYDKLDGKISKEDYSYLEIIGRNGKNLLDLINDILDISRIESGKVELDVSSFNINKLISEVYSMFTVQAQEKSILLEHKNSNEKIKIISDYDKLRHVIQNLLSNAVKFTEEGFVTVDSKVLNDRVIIKVQDSGIGIAQENLDSIFEEFKQAESGTSRRFGGTGLGLSIAKNYTEIIGGKLSVTSTIGVGSTFIIEIPLAIEGDYNQVETVEEINLLDDYESVSKDFDKRVLLVEDNESVIIQMRELIQGMGVDILVAENGEKGLSMLKNHRVDGIILDLMMPGIDGFEVLTKVRNDDLTADLPVLILTAKHLTKSDLSMLKRNNIHQVIQKGDIDRIHLQSTVFNMLYSVKVKKSKKIKKSTTPKILIVEDNPDNRTTLKAILKGFADLYEAVDGLEGIKMADEVKPDLILMDIALPKVSGVEAFHKIKEKEEHKNLPIIAVTASALEEEKEKILRHGFDEFVSKPVNPKHLMEVIKGVLYSD